MGPAKRDWRQIAEELRSETDPEKILSLAAELEEVESAPAKLSTVMPIPHTRPRMLNLESPGADFSKIALERKYS